METWHYVAIVVALLVLMWMSGILTVSYSVEVSEHMKRGSGIARLGNALTQFGSALSPMGRGGAMAGALVH